MPESAHDILVRELLHRAEVCRNNAAAADRTYSLGASIIPELRQDSPWIIVESAMQDAASNVYNTETTNAAIYEAAAKAIRDQA